MPGTRLSQVAVEVLATPDKYPSRVSQVVAEVLASTPTPSPTTVTGAGVTQLVAEVLNQLATDVRVSQIVAEVLGSTASGSSSGGTGTSSWVAIG